MRRHQSRWHPMSGRPSYPCECWESTSTASSLHLRSFGKNFQRSWGMRQLPCQCVLPSPANDVVLTNGSTLQTLLVTAENGSTSTIMDSYHIAQYVSQGPVTSIPQIYRLSGWSEFQLERRFSTPTHSLFAPAGNGAPEDVLAGRNFARFMEEFVRSTHTTPLIRASS